MGSCSEGVDFNDFSELGQYPRFVLLSPCYSAIRLYQFAGRFLRQKSTSKPVIHYVYIKRWVESKVCAALSRKGQIMSETTPEQAVIQVNLPGSFLPWYEGGVKSDPYQLERFGEEVECIKTGKATRKRKKHEKRSNRLLMGHSSTNQVITIDD